MASFYGWFHISSVHSQSLSWLGFPYLLEWPKPSSPKSLSPRSNLLLLFVGCGFLLIFIVRYGSTKGNLRESSCPHWVASAWSPLHTHLICSSQQKSSFLQPVGSVVWGAQNNEVQPHLQISGTNVRIPPTSAVGRVGNKNSAGRLLGIIIRETSPPSTPWFLGPCFLALRNFTI